MTSFNASVVDYWTGCGISTLSTPGTASRGQSHPLPWACILDCPRTSVENDYGQPSTNYADPNAPDGDQWFARAVIFLFRNKQNFTVIAADGAYVNKLGHLGGGKDYSLAAGVQGPPAPLVQPLESAHAPPLLMPIHHVRRQLRR